MILRTCSQQGQWWQVPKLPQVGFSYVVYRIAFVQSTLLA